MSKPRKNMLSDLIADVGNQVRAETSQEPAAPPAPVQAAPVEAPAPAAAPEPLTVAEAAPEAAAAPAEAPREVVTIRPARAAAAKPARQTTLRARSKQVTLYLEEPVYDALREIAHVERSKMHQLIVEGIDLLLKKKGSPSINSLIKKAG